MNNINNDFLNTNPSVKDFKKKRYFCNKTKKWFK